jgi:hypothetical protein
MAPARQELAALLLLALGLGLVVAWASLSLRAGTRPDTLYNLHAVLSGEPFRTGAEMRADLPFYNRVLFPLLHRGLARALPFASDSQCYGLLRIMSFQAAFVAFALVCRRGLAAPLPAAALASALLAVATIASFNFPWEDPSDAFDLLVLALGVGAALGRRFLWCLGLAVVFASNRESAAFLGLVWGVVTVSRHDALRRTVEGAAICGLSYGTALLLKTALGPAFIANYGTPAVNLVKLKAGLAALDPIGWLPMLAAMLVLFAVLVDLRAGPVRRFLGLAGLFAGTALLFGLVDELRVFLPTFVMLGFAVAASVNGAQRSAV